MNEHFFLGKKIQHVPPTAWAFNGQNLKFIHFVGVKKNIKVVKLTSSTMTVDMALPVSKHLPDDPLGPRCKKINLVGRGTSVKSPIVLASVSLMNAVIGYRNESNSPTQMLAASAPSGIFFMNGWLS